MTLPIGAGAAGVENPGFARRVLAKGIRIG